MPKQPRRIVTTPSAYTYPLLIKQLLHTPLLYAADKEIVYRDKLRFTYKELYKRINRLASALTALGVGAGDTVAVMDWDSHRYLECFFAIPGLGAIMHTVNIRLSPDQILYTMNHAEDDVVLVHEEFLPVLESIAPRLETAKTFILLKDGDEAPTTSLPLAGEYEDLLSKASDSFNFPELDENTQATRSTQPGPPEIPRESTTVIDSSSCTLWARPWERRALLHPPDFSRAMCTCPLPPCSMCMPGGYRFSRRCLGPSRCILGGTSRPCCCSSSSGRR